MRAAIYARLSYDPNGTSTATERQEADARAKCAAEGWTVDATFVDNDISAFDPKVKRPAFEKLLRAIAAGDIDTVVVWKTDRLARRGRDLQRFLDACEPHGVTLTSVTEPAFVGPTGLLMLRLVNGFAEHESSVKAERVTRALKEQATHGEPHRGGRRVFGYDRDFKPNAEAALVRIAVKRILAGDSSHAVVKHWNETGVLTVSGGRWTVSNFTRMLRAPVFAGLRTYHGEIIQGTWEPLIDRATWDMLQVMLAARAKPQKRITRHLLTGLAYCACGAPMNGASRNTWTEYRCNAERGGCGRVTIRGAMLEDAVRDALFAEAPKLRAAQRAKGKQANTALADELKALDADVEALDALHTARWVDRAISHQAFLKAQSRLDERIAAQRVLIAQRHVIAPFTDLERRWEHGSVTWRREVLDATVQRVVVSPGRSKRVAITFLE